MNTEPLSPPEDPTSKGHRAWLSALADGESQALEPGCAQWREGPLARQDWHTWHLIGDVMRSEELATSPRHDADFLHGLHVRLAEEPVVLAPGPLTVPRRAAPVWLMPSLAAAVGVVVVAGALVMSRSGDAPSSDQLAAAAGPTPVRGATVVRDPRLDEFLRVHQFARGGVAVAAPAAELRRVDLVAPVAAPR